MFKDSPICNGRNSSRDLQTKPSRLLNRQGKQSVLIVIEIDRYCIHPIAPCLSSCHRPWFYGRSTQNPLLQPQGTWRTQPQAVKSVKRLLTEMVQPLQARTCFNANCICMHSIHFIAVFLRSVLYLFHDMQTVQHLVAETKRCQQSFCNNLLISVLCAWPDWIIVDKRIVVQTVLGRVGVFAFVPKTSWMQSCNVDISTNIEKI